MICSITLLEESWEESNPTDVVIIMRREVEDVVVKDRAAAF
jgi:hypothetical protein